jgi:hypothetical protein
LRIGGQPRLEQLVGLIVLVDLEERLGQRPSEVLGPPLLLAGEPAQRPGAETDPRRQEFAVADARVPQLYFDVAEPVVERQGERETAIELIDGADSGRLTSSRS